MTTYVLHGGKTSRDCPETDRFFKQFVELVDKPKIKYLMCYWARPRAQWQPLFERDKAKVLRQTDKKVTFEIVEDPTDLFDKLSKADGLYVAGGDAKPIERYYPDLKGLKKALEGKVYLGSSMGAFLASKKYVLSLSDQDEDTVHEGVGLLPINTLCHWNVEVKKQMKFDLLRMSDPKTPVITLNELEFVTLYL